LAENAESPGIGVMTDRKTDIEKLIAETAQLHEDGEYREAYNRAMDAMTLVAGFPSLKELEPAVCVSAARSAYYLSNFTECLELLSRIDVSKAQTAPVSGKGEDGASLPLGSRIGVEAAIIRSNVLRRLGHYCEALETLGVGMPERLDGLPPRIVIEALLARGACMYNMGMPVQAREELETSLGLATHNNDKRARARVLVMLGLVARSMGFMDKAADYFSRGKDLCRSLGDEYGEAAALLNEAIVFYHAGMFGKSEKSVSRARSLFGKIEWSPGICRSLLVQGNIRRECGDYEGALKSYSRAGKMAQQLGYRKETALFLAYSASVSENRGDYKQALALLDESLAVADAVSAKGEVASEVRMRIGQVLLKDGKVAEAEKHLESSLSLAGSNRDSLCEGLVLRTIGTLKFHSGSESEGKNAFRESINILRACGCSHELARTHVMYASVLCGIDARGFEGREKAGMPACLPADADEAIRCLMEAGHLLSVMDDDFLRSKTDELLDRLLSFKRTRGLIRTSPAENGRIISIGYDPEIMIAGRLAAVSSSMLELWKRIEFAGTFSKPVLVTGETGTGKELVAGLIHEVSNRSKKPFVPVNCAAIPDHLFESEFFGHRKGCFTGAATDRKGFFEEADGGTLFLDEVGELTSVQQVKLLRVLQEGKIRRIGENVERPVDVRIISATNRNLENMIDESAFREDFYYRINVDQIHIEPLRKRPEDIMPLIAWRLCGNGNGANAEQAVRIEESVLRSLQVYHWPGNVRELISILDRLAYMGRGGVINFDMLPERIKDRFEADRGINETGPDIVEHASNNEKLKKVMNICRGNKAAAARWLGISRGTLYKELKRSGLGYYIR